MNASWSWASLAIKNQEEKQQEILKVTSDLSTCPKMQDRGQMDKSVLPLQYTAADWQAFYEERAGIAEHDGRQPCDKAESMAYESCISHWMNKNPPAHNQSNACPECYQSLGDRPIAISTGNGSHLWLHDKCHTLWLARRRQQAITVLNKIGFKAKGNLYD